MNPLSLVPSWVWAIAVAVLLGLCGVQTVRIAGLKTDIAVTAAAHDKAVAKQQSDRAESERQAREREQQMTAAAAKLLQDKQHENAIISDRLNTALNSLRDRPERPATVSGSVPSFGATCKGATGAELYRSDGEFLAREAARANTIRAALAECYGRFDSIAEVTGTGLHK